MNYELRLSLMKLEVSGSRFLVYQEENLYTAHAAGALALSGATKEAKRSFLLYRLFIFKVYSSAASNCLLRSEKVSAF